MEDSTRLETFKCARNLDTDTRSLEGRIQGLIQRDNTYPTSASQMVLQRRGKVHVRKALDSVASVS